MVDYTPILRLVQPDFDQTPWDEDVNNNFAVLDATYGKFIGVPGMTGAWRNATAYVVGQSAVDTIGSTIWQCAVSHTSAVSPTTFAQDRTAHPTYWTSIGALLVYLPTTGGVINGDLAVTGTVTVDGEATASVFASGTGYSILSTQGFLGGDATVSHLIWDVAQWRLEYVRASGTLHYIAGGTNTNLFSIDGLGNVIAKGTITASGSPVVTEARIAKLEARIAALEAKV